MKKPNWIGNFDLPLLFWLIALIALINAISFSVLIPLLYPYAKQFGLSDFQASLLTTAFAFSQFLGTPILGKLSDRLGRKYILVFSLLGTVIANILSAIATVAWLLYFSRMLDGLTGGNNSVASAVISDITTPAQRPRAFGIFGATFRLGFVVGPVLSYFAQQLPTLPGVSPLGMSFLASAAIAFVATVLAFLFLPETNPVDNPQGRFQLGWDDFAFGKIAQSATRPTLGKLFILTLLSGSTFTIFAFAFQPFFLNVLDQDAKGLAIMFALVGILGFCSQVFALEPLSNRFNLIDIIAASLALRGVSFLLMPTFPTYGAFIVVLIFFGIVNSFSMPLIDTVLSLNSERREQGEVLGINSAYLSMSNAIGPVISGLLVSLSYTAPFWITGVLTILVAWFALNLKSRFRCDRV